MPCRIRLYFPPYVILEPKYEGKDLVGGYSVRTLTRGNFQTTAIGHPLKIYKILKHSFSGITSYDQARNAKNTHPPPEMCKTLTPLP